MYLLDTNVASQRTKIEPVASVMAWLRDVPSSRLFLSVITIQEIRSGIEWMPDGRKRRSIEEWLERDVLVRFADRLLPVDIAVADLCGRIIVEARRAKHTPTLDDALIAATARVHGFKLATLNRHHFERLGVELVKF